MSESDTTPEQEALLLEAYSFGCTHEEAEVHSGMSHMQWCGYCSRHPEFLLEYERNKLKPSIEKKKMIHDAKKTLANKITTESGDAKWALERLDRDFSPRSKHELTGANEGPIKMESEKAQLITKALEDMK